MRLSSRKLQVVTANLGTYFLEHGQLQRVMVAVRGTSRALGAVRDLDVFLELLHSRLKPEELPAEEARELEALLQHLRQLHLQQVTALIHWFEGALFRELAELARSPLMGRAKGPRVAHELPLLLHRRQAAVLAYALEHADASGLPPGDAQLHALRIRLKHMRFLLDAFKELLGEEAVQFMREVKALQDLIGAVHDPHVELQMLRELAAPVLGNRHAPLLEQRLKPMLSESIQSRREELLPAWKRFCSVEIKRLLGLAIAAL